MSAKYRRTVRQPKMCVWTYVHMHVYEYIKRGGELDMPPSINRISA
jgi:hypothetical protein